MSSPESSRESSEEESTQTISVGVVTDNSGYYDQEWYADIAQEFHRVYPDYRLEVKTYTTGSSDFSMELLKGDGPDLMELDWLDADMLAHKGVLEPLDSYFDSSNQVKAADLLPSVRNACQTGSQTTRIIESFTLQGIVTQSGIARDGGWTCDDYLEQRGQEGALLYWNETPRFLFSNLLKMELNNYVDWDKQECFFTESRFLELLKKAKSRASDKTLEFTPYGADSFRQNKVLTVDAGINSISAYQSLKEAFGENADFVGYPNEEGLPMYQMTVSRSFGMNSASPHKEGAWAFLELILSKDYQEREIHSFSVREDIFTRNLSATDNAASSDIRINNYDGLPYQDPLPEPTDEERQKVRYIADHAFLGDNGTGVISVIVLEDALSYFTDEKEPEDVAETIQSRVMLYLNE